MSNAYPGAMGEATTCAPARPGVAMGLPTLDALGADGAMAHTYDEHIFLDKLVPRQTLLIRLLQTLR